MFGMVEDKETEKIRTHNHPIAAKHVEASHQHGVTVEDVHTFLEEVAQFTSEEHVRMIADATPYDALAENEDSVGTYTDATWEEIFEGIGLTYDSDEHDEIFVDHAQSAVTSSHKKHGVAELEMDHNQPTSMLVASKDK
jgi:hypothetical protein